MSIRLKKTPKKDFLKQIKDRPGEDLRLIADIEKYLINKRGYVFRPPKPGTPVILLFSAGLDSTTAWSLLIEKYQLDVFPIFLKGSDLRQKKAYNFFTNYFKKRYPQSYRPPMIVKNNSVPKEFAGHFFETNKMNPDFILEQIVNLQHKHEHFLAGTTSNFTLEAMYYLKFLESQYNLRIRHIYIAVTASDGDEINSQNLTHLRKNLLFLETFVADIQLLSPFFEPELKLLYRKHDIINLAIKQLDLPLEKTISCSKNWLIHCGQCPGCYVRQLEFKASGQLDKTVYYNKLVLVQFYKKLIAKIKGKTHEIISVTKN